MVDVRPAVSSTVCLCLFGMSSCGRDMQRIKGGLCKMKVGKLLFASS